MAYDKHFTTQFTLFLDHFDFKLFVWHYNILCVFVDSFDFLFSQNRNFANHYFITHYQVV